MAPYGQPWRFKSVPDVLRHLPRRGRASLSAVKTSTSSIGTAFALTLSKKRTTPRCPPSELAATRFQALAAFFSLRLRNDGHKPLICKEMLEKGSVSVIFR
jgi:hypothetical protein